MAKFEYTNLHYSVSERDWNLNIITYIYFSFNALIKTTNAVKS